MPNYCRNWAVLQSEKHKIIDLVEQSKKEGFNILDHLVPMPWGMDSESQDYWRSHYWGVSSGSVMDQKVTMLNYFCVYVEFTTAWTYPYKLYGELEKDGWKVSYGFDLEGSTEPGDSPFDDLHHRWLGHCITIKRRKEDADQT